MKTNKKTTTLALGGSFNMSSGEDKDAYYTEIVQHKDSKELVLIIRIDGKDEFKEEIINTLKNFDWDDENDNYIHVSDIHGYDVLKP